MAWLREISFRKGIHIICNMAVDSNAGKVNSWAMSLFESQSSIQGGIKNAK